MICEMELPLNYNKLSQIERRTCRELYVVRQFGRCYHCKERLNAEPHIDILNKHVDLSLFPKGFLNNPVHLHHNHKTGMTIGAVHARCNAVLWQYHGE
jgi:hypothetical protein